MPIARNRQEALANTAEALAMVRAIGSVSWKSAVPGADHIFLYDMFDKASQYKEGLVVNSRQLARLRTIRQGLVERGLLPPAGADSADSVGVAK